MRKITHVHFTTQLILWIGFGSFLSMSIPHVAWLFEQYDPGDWIICYGIAIGIDVLSAWLSYVVSRKPGRLAYVYIFVLSLLSQYANFLYAMYQAERNPLRGDAIWSIHLFGLQMTTGFITPIIISLIPYATLAYTYAIPRIHTISYPQDGESVEVRTEIAPREDNSYGVKIRELARENRAITPREIREAVGCSDTVARKWLARVRETEPSTS